MTAVAQQGMIEYEKEIKGMIHQLFESLEQKDGLQF
jgi:hypothetical protein